MRHSIPVLALVTIGVAAATGCSSDNGPSTASIIVKVETTGSPLDPDGYQVVIGSSAGKPIGINDSLTIADANTGNQLVRLDGVSPNCGVLTPNPQPAVVLAGSTSVLQFKIVCAANSGLLRVITTTTGQDVDPDGYLLHITGAPDRHIAANGNDPQALTPEGTHPVSLAGLAPNCAASPANPTSVTVVAHDSATLRVAVLCSHIARLDVAITTSGPDTDADGYRIVVEPSPADGSRPTIAKTGTTSVEVPALLPGIWRVRIDHVATNCIVTGADQVLLTADSTDLHATFTVNCARLGELIYSSQGHIYTANADGTNERQLTPDNIQGHTEFDPEWSPDATRIVYLARTNQGPADTTLHIFLMRADGSQPTQVTSGAADDEYPTWSPDGSRLAFTRGLPGATRYLFTMRPDGTDLRQVTNFGVLGCSWSPDGQRIAYGAASSGHLESIGADGGDVRTILARSDTAFMYPAWSSGGRIAMTAYTNPFAGFFSLSLVIVNADGTGEYGHAGSDTGFPVAAAWSPDGGRLAYYFESEGETPLGVTRADGTGTTQLPVVGNNPSWHP